RRAARMQEVFAAFLTHTDEHVGRVLDLVDEIGNTVVILLSDNGASGEGERLGFTNEWRRRNLPGREEPPLFDLDLYGGPKSHGNYPAGWAMAGNTPFKLYKKTVYEGGIADPCIVAGASPDSPRAIAPQYHHAVDVTPTILELVGIDHP